MSAAKRTVQFHFRATEKEAAMIRAHMAESGIGCLAAYMRKMAIDGYVVHLDLKDAKEIVTLLRRCSNNLNQYAKKANESGSIYAADIGDLGVRLDEIRKEAKRFLSGLADIP
jgi:hypothetical protein